MFVLLVALARVIAVWGVPGEMGLRPCSDARLRQWPVMPRRWCCLCLPNPAWARAAGWLGRGMAGGAAGHESDRLLDHG